jgi:hypothetical protein
VKSSCLEFGLHNLISQASRKSRVWVSKSRLPPLAPPAGAAAPGANFTQDSHSDLAA